MKQLFLLDEEIEELKSHGGVVEHTIYSFYLKNRNQLLVISASASD